MRRAADDSRRFLVVIYFVEAAANEEKFHLRVKGYLEGTIN